MGHGFRIFLLLSMLAALAGCGRTGNGAESADASAATPPAAAAGNDAGAGRTATPDEPGAPAVDGADAIPDRDADPAGFWTWRVEQMFANRDVDGDGFIARDEFQGNPAEFDVIDADGDGRLEKSEFHDYVFARFVIAPESPAE